MSINIPNALLAFGSVSAAGVKVSGAGFTSAQSGVGIYTLTPDQEVDATQCALLVTARTAGLIATAEQTSDSVKTVNMFDDAGAAADGAFDFLLLRAPG